jgi:hypothetical protein
MPFLGMTDPWWIAIFTNAILIIGSLWLGSIRLTAKIGAIEGRIGTLLNTHELKAVNDTSILRSEIYKNSHDFGETIAALKQKIFDVELFASNHYVRREGMIQLTDSITALRSELRADLLRMEQKIDSKT